MAGEMHLYSVGDELPESTGDKLPTGDIDSTLLGKLWTALGSGFTGCLYSSGEQSYIKTVGDACLGTICILRWGILRFSGDTQLP